MRVPLIAVALALALLAAVTTAVPAERATLKLIHEYRAGRGLCVHSTNQQCTRFSLSQSDFKLTYPHGRRDLAPRTVPHPFRTFYVPGSAIIAPFTSTFAAEVDGVPILQQFYAATKQPLRVPHPMNGPLVMIVDYDHAPKAEADLGAFRQQYNLSPCTIASGCLTIFNTAGAVENPNNPQTFPTYDPYSDGYFQQETMLDLEAVSAICPFCRIALVEADINQERPDNSVLLSKAVSVANTVKPLVISISYAYNESAASDNEVNMATIHRAIFVSSGDNGYIVGDPGYPASSPHATAVGEVNHYGGAVYALPGSGSGCSAVFAAPIWQRSLQLCANRAYADLAGQGNYFPEYDSYCPRAFWQATGLCGWYVSGGTSLSAPLMAGLYAYASSLVFLPIGVPHTRRPIAVPGALYTKPATAFVDATETTFLTTSNGEPCTTTPRICNLGPGWDGATGFGVPAGPATFLTP